MLLADFFFSFILFLFLTVIFCEDVYCQAIFYSNAKFHQFTGLEVSLKLIS